MLNRQQSITLTYLLGSQTGHDFETISAKELARNLSDEGEETIDMLLTAFRVKMGQLVRGAIEPNEMITFIDLVAENKGGVIYIDSDDADLQGEVNLMRIMLQG